MKANTFRATLVKTGIAASILLAASGAAFAQSTVTLTAAPQNTMLPDGQNVPMWGYTCGAVTGTGVSCTAMSGAAQAGGTAWQPPLIKVPSGQPLTITLVNQLSFATSLTPNTIPTSLVIVGQVGGGLGGAPTRTASPAHAPQGPTWPASGAPDPSIDCANPTSALGAPALGTNCPPPQPARVQSFATEVATGTSSALVWNNLRPGTYLIHSGTHPSIQHPMGLYGVLVVTSPGYPVANDTDVALLLSEIDAVQNRAVDTAVKTVNFSATKVWSGLPGKCGDLSDTATAEANTCYPPAVNYDPRYYLMNGISFDRTIPANSALAVSAGATAGSVLLRFVNAGLRMHVPSVVGLQMKLHAEDGNVLPGLPKVQTQVFLAAGKTYDVTVQPSKNPLDATQYAAATYAVYDRQLSLSTNNQRDGGMQVYLQVAGGAPLPAAAVLTASIKTYYCVPGVTLNVTEAATGLLAGATGANGVVLDTVGLAGTASPLLSLQSDGTFIYSQLPTDATCGGTFSYKVNGTLPMTATITQCNAGSTCDKLGAAPTANPDVYTSNVASRLQISPPGVLENDTDPSGLPLKVDVTSVIATGVTLSINADGSFVATPTGPGTHSFTYKAKNSQGSLSGVTTVTLNFLTPNAPVVAIKDAITGNPINDYRWIIEEDRTFFVDPKCQVNSTNPAVRPATCPPLPVQSLGYNFHTAYMPVVAAGCVGAVSCEAGQTLLAAPAACDIGNGACRTDAAQKVSVLPNQVHLDPTKRYFISVLPGDGVNPVIGGAGGPDASGKPFNIATACGPYITPTGAWEPGGLAALCGHAMGGAPIAAFAGPTAPPIDIRLQQTPLPTATIAVFVFQDDNPLNGEVDTGAGVDTLAPNEPGLGGFELKLFDQAGGFGDSTGQITYDMFNMPVSNALAGTIDPVTGFNACPITVRTDGLVGMIPTCPKYESDGVSLSPLAGQAIIANLYPGLYEITATPGADRIGRGEEWLQTNTLDGTKTHEAFLKPNEPGYFQEFGPGGFHVSIGFANPKIINDRLQPLCDGLRATNPSACTATLNVQVTSARMSRTPDQRLYSSGSYDAYSFTQCYLAIGPADGPDFALQKCDANGKVTFTGLPKGDFKLTVFDQWNDLMLDGLVSPVRVDGNTTLKQFPVTQWRTNLYTRTFIDTNRDGVSQASEPGLPLASTNIRYRDGSYGFFNNTDLDGYAGFNEVFPFMSWLVVETDTTRHKPTGIHVVYDAGGPADGTAGGGTSTIGAGLANTLEAHSVPPSLRVPGAVYCTNADCTGSSIQSGTYYSGLSGNSGPTGGLSTGRIDPPQVWGSTQAWQGLLGQNSFIEFGMTPFKEGENGGIKGHVIYASTRPFDDPALLLQLSWEPGVPRVKINLYQQGTAPDGTKSLKLVDSTTTSSWDDWAQGFRADGVPNMNCPGQDATSPFFQTLRDSTQWLDPSNPKRALPNNAQFKCYDGWSMLNQVQPAPYDGMYKFPSVTAIDPATGKPSATNCAICSPNPDDGTPMLPAGKYVVEVIVPPGFELVKEEDKNILLGDVYIAPITTQFAGLGNVFIMPDQAAVNAFYNKNNPLNQATNFGHPRHEGDTGSVETFWPCVGAMRVVPDYNSLFPGAGQNSPFAGALRPLCDRKEVTLKHEMSVLAKFYVFTSTHIAGHFNGTITNDFASEFDPFSPQFGEKFGPPNLPVAMRDFNGNEITRVYADQWGLYNGLFFSTYGVNPPNPTGYVPQMAIACMNDPGPIPGPGGTMITDPNYSPAYSNFCYETPFMPGFTAYMDTPVIPTMAFAEGYNLPDCEYPDATPAIASVVNTNVEGTLPAGRGPWVSTSGLGHKLTITALGTKEILNPAYSGPAATGAPYNQKKTTRHYGFGTTAGTVTLVGADGVSHPLTTVVWSDTTITGDVPANVPLCNASNPAYKFDNAAARCGELVIIAANGKKSIDTIGVTIGGRAPTYVTTSSPSSNHFGEILPNPLQAAIDNATPGDLIFVAPGIYKENLLMWKPVRLQGVGAASVTINADAHPAGKMDAWRRQVNCLFGLALNGQPSTGAAGSNPFDASGLYTCPATMRQRSDRIPLEGILGWDVTLNGNLAQMMQEPTLMGAYEGAGITVLGKGTWIPVGAEQFGIGAEGGFPVGYRYLNSSTSTQGSNADCRASGLSGSSSSSNPNVAGRDYYSANFLCNPSRIDGISVINSSQGGGAIFLHGWNHYMEIANNRISANHGTLTGGITVGNGEFPDPSIVGATPGPVVNQPAAGLADGEQAGYGFNRNVNVHHNSITANASIGDALYSGTPSGAGGVTFCSGSDNYQLKYNWVCGNLSTGDGAGVVHSGFSNDAVIANNWILFNQSVNPTLPTNGGGIAVSGASPDPTLPNGTECGAITDQDCPPGLSEGTGRNLVIDANLIAGNSAESGSGGGIRLQMVNGQEVPAFPLNSGRWHGITLTNNVIANNVAGWDGAGISMQDVLKASIINNTLVSNDTTASAGVLFKTIGSAFASTPPPGCDPSTGPDATCYDPNAPVADQPAGLVTMMHTANLRSALPGIVLCPSGYGYTGGILGFNANCRTDSLPLLTNNLFWQNRAFHITLSGPGSGLQSQQNVVTLTPALNQTSTGACMAGAVYWDIGVRGDTSASNPTILVSLGGGGGAQNPTLHPTNSILTSYSGRYSGNGNLAPSTGSPVVIAQYCNGSRVPPENGGQGYNAPAGRSETTGLTEVFTVANIRPAATVDEGKNWINLSFGPLTLSKPNVTTPTAAELMVASGTPAISGGAYSIPGNSPAVNAGTNTGAPNHDFFGTARPQAGTVDIGAVEVPLTNVARASVSPNPLAFGNWALGTTSPTMNVTVTNSGGAALAGGTFTLGGGTPQPFSRVTTGTFPTGAPNCGAALAVGASCTVKVQFAPATATAFSRTLTVAYTNAGLIVTGSPVTLTGTGVATRATVSITPSPMTVTLPSGLFNVTGTGTVTLTNTAPVVGGASMTVSSLAVSGGSMFTYFFNVGAAAGPDNCTGATLAPGASCTVEVRFTNVLAARGTNRAGTITFTDNAQPIPSQSGGLVGFATP